VIPMQKQQDDHFTHLLDFVKHGWEIDEPVLFGPMCHFGSRTGKYVYHFVLRNKVEDTTVLLSLPPSSRLQTFLTKNEIRIGIRSLH